MARTGIPQAQVNETADALLRAGERPTIERVRQALGTGSPNTIVRLLDAWWAALGQRLATHETKLALPDAPDAVVAAASQLWLTALAEAQTLATNALAAEKAAFTQERQALGERAQALEAAMIDACELTEAAVAARLQAETRCTDLERLAATQSAQLTDLQAQRDALQSERGTLSTRVTELLDATEQLRLDAATERRALEAQARLSEDRWLQEVDRGRLESAQLQKALARRESEASKAAATITALEKDTAGTRSALERLQSGSAARIDALEKEIERLHTQLRNRAAVAKRASPKNPGKPTRRRSSPKTLSKRGAGTS